MSFVSSIFVISVLLIFWLLGNADKASADKIVFPREGKEDLKWDYEVIMYGVVLLVMSCVYKNNSCRGPVALVGLTVQNMPFLCMSEVVQTVTHI